MSWFYNLKITGKLAVSFGFLLIVLAVQTATVWTNLAALKQNQSWTEHTYKVLGQTDGLISGMVNQETGLRGYLIAGNPKFLEPLEAGRRDYETAFNEVKKLTSDNPVQQERLARLDRFARDWERNIADRQITLMRDPATQGQARQLEASGAGKQAMDGLRGIAKEIRDEELSLLGTRSENAAAARQSTRTALLGGGLLALLLIVGIGASLWRLVAAPLQKMTGALDRLADGDLAQTLATLERTDEVGTLSATLARLRDQLAAAEDMRSQQSSKEEQLKAEQAKVIVDSIGSGLASLAEGNLTARVEQELTGPFAKLRDDFNTAAAMLEESMAVLSEAASGARTGSVEIASAAEDLARRTEQDASSIQETSAGVSDMTSRLTASAQTAQATLGCVKDASSTVDDGRTMADEATTAMNRVSESAKGIDDVIEGLDKIAFQTRVLAMNAAVEAGRAGEAGRGFAVVADLVSSLAMRAEEEAKQARDQLTATQIEVTSAVAAVERVDSALSQIKANVGQAHKMVAELTADNQAQASTIGQISAAVLALDSSIQKNAAMVEETSAAARNMAGEIGIVAQQAAKFQLQGARTVVSSAAATRRQRTVIDFGLVREKVRA